MLNPYKGPMHFVQDLRYAMLWFSPAAILSRRRIHERNAYHPDGTPKSLQDINPDDYDYPQWD